jgi:hypothetical protein
MGLCRRTALPSARTAASRRLQHALAVAAWEISPPLPTGAGAAAAATPAASGMSRTERFLFDLNGFLVVRGVLDAAEVAQANAAIDAHAGEF